jgi:hypothetical protein
MYSAAFARANSAIKIVRHVFVAIATSIFLVYISDHARSEKNGKCRLEEDVVDRRAFFPLYGCQVDTMYKYVQINPPRERRRVFYLKAMLPV